MLHYNKITEKEGIDKTNGQDCHGKTNFKSRECYYCLNYFFVFKNFKYNFNLCDDCYRCKQREKVWKSAYFWIIKIKSGTFKTASDYESSKIINLLEKSQLDEEYSVLNKEKKNLKKIKKSKFIKLLKMIKALVFIWSLTTISHIETSVLYIRPKRFS